MHLRPQGPLTRAAHAPDSSVRTDHSGGAVHGGDLREHRHDVEFTKLTLHDTYLAMVQEGWAAAERKVRLLRLAMTSLALAGVTLAVGIALGGGHG